jgi:hypothetical protein
LSGIFIQRFSSEERGVVEAAVHQAGHILVAAKMGHHVPVASLYNEENEEEHFPLTCLPYRRISDVEELVQRCRLAEQTALIMLAGHEAEKLFGGMGKAQASRIDYRRAEVFLSSVVATTDELDSSVRRFAVMARATLMHRVPLLLDVAEAIINKLILDSRDIARIIKGRL